MISNLISLFGAAAPKCTLEGGSFLSLPHWYQYLQGTVDGQGNCTPAISGINDTWLIVAAAIEILLRVAAILAVGMIIFAGVTYVTSQGEPEKTGQAKSTLVNALVGLAVAVMASFIVTFIARSVQ